MRASKKDIAVRRKSFRAVFEKRLHKPIDFKLFIDQLKTDTEGDRQQTIGNRAVRDTFERWKTELEGEGFDIEHLGVDHLIINDAQSSSADDRKQQNKDIKAQLGAALWEWLLGIDLSEFKPFKNGATLKGSAAEKVAAKMRALRRKSEVSISIDAGTTTQAVVEALLSSESFPLQIPSSHQPSDNPLDRVGFEEGITFMSPRIFTNSITIAQTVSRKALSHRSLRDIDVSIIGGKIRFARGSIVGTYARTALESWKTTTDVSVIGTTGFINDYVGRPSFACDDLAEAQMKSHLLSNAWFKTVILDSSKLEGRKVSSVFVPVSAAALDLIIIDDGSRTEQTERVNGLALKAEQFGVACLIVKTKDV